MTTFTRGQVYWATFDEAVGRKPWLVVSNNARNRRLEDVLVARITSTPKPHISSIVELPHGECVAGSVLCDDIIAMDEHDAPELAGALSPSTMRRVDAALAAALGLG
ncbi:MAG: MazF family transcriptional regulator [Actinobacteria bacterium HGW-Actinobacteria-4]|nr:MAG: MazF family transcriptional regulator [Actinobacteria bacterium HGW-Actinobacteria-4]